jgi:hypothetical protein
MQWLQIIFDGSSTTNLNMNPLHLIKHEVVETATSREDRIVHRDVRVMQFIIQHLPSLFRISNVHSTFRRAANTHSCLPLLVVALSPVNLWLHNHHPPSPLLSMVGCYVIIILRLLRLSATLFCLLPPSCNHPRSRRWPPAALTTHNQLPAATLHVNKSIEIDLMMSAASYNGAKMPLQQQLCRQWCFLKLFSLASRGDGEGAHNNARIVSTCVVRCTRSASSS